MDVFDLSAKLTLDKKEYENGLEDAKTKGSSFGTTLATAGKVAGAGIVAVGTAVAGLTVKTAEGIKQTADYGDAIDKTSQKLGVSAKTYQEYDYVMNLAGTSMADMTTGLKTLTNKLDDAKNGSEDSINMFKQLGISIEDISNMSREDIFKSAIEGFQNLEDSTERASLANDLFGKSGQNLTPLFNMTAEETKGLIQNFNDMGAVMSDEAVKASANFEDALTTLQASLKGIKNSSMADFLPSITKVMDGLTGIFSGDSNSGIGKINEGINEFITKLSDSIPKILDVGADIVESLAKAIMDNLPKIIDSGADIVMKLADIILDNLPELIKIGLDIILSLADGIANNLPDLIPTIIDVILQITETLLNNTDKIIEGGMKLIVGLTTGLIKAIPKLVAELPTIIVAIVKGLISGVSEMKSAGRQLIDGLWQGIKDTWTQLKENVKSLANGLISSVKGIFGIHSPSRVFSEIGQQLVNGLNEGSDDMFSTNGLNAKVTANVTGNVGTEDINNSFSIDYAKLGQSVANALTGFSINMDGRSVAQLLANDMNYQLGVLNARRV